MRNPTRRSRNIGTAKQGYGQNNRMVIPTRTHPEQRDFVANLGAHTSQKRVVGRNSLLFLVEEPREGCVHACSIDDIVAVLERIPADDLGLLDCVVLRQPKRKEEQLDGAWGRYWPAVYLGNSFVSAVFLEVLDLRQPLRWAKPLAPMWSERLDRLRSQGHSVTETPRYYEISSTLEAVRQTQLFETLPHEIGHHLHSVTDDEFWQRTKREREEYAERYAREFAERG